MSHVTNLKKAVFLTAGITDAHINKMEYDWLVQLYGSAPSNTLPGMWYHYLLSQGQAESSLPGMMDRWLVGLGYTTGSIDGKLAAMWAAGGPPAGFDGIMQADYETGADLTTYQTSATGTLHGGATVHDGLLDMYGGVLSRKVEYDGDNFTATQTGCINMLIQFEKANSVDPQYVFNFTPAGTLGANSLVLFLQSSDDQWYIYDKNNTNGWINGASFAGGAWNPTPDQTYEIELNFDYTAGATRLFIDGTQYGITRTGTGARSAGSTEELFLGNSYAGFNSEPEMKILDFKVWDTVQHTSDY